MSSTKNTAKKVLNTTTGKRNPNSAKSIVAKRDKQGMSWGDIAEALDIAPRTVRRIYDEVKGEGAHFASRIPGKGGRVRKG